MPSVLSFGRHRWRLPAIVLCALFLASIARFYHPQYGFTALLVFWQDAHEYELPALRALPHFEYGAGMGYDGSYYAQLALEPLLRDSAIDRALDDPPYRARRILFSWTAYVLGFGRPWWILQVYALQNVVTWLLLAWLMTRWLPLSSARTFALWTAVMFSHGLLASVRLAVLDGPSMLLLALAIAASEKGRLWLSAAVLGVAGLARETNLLGIVSLPWRPRWQGVALTIAAAIVALVPLLVWQDYVWSIYRGSSTSAGVSHITPPLVAYAEKWQAVLSASKRAPFAYASIASLAVLVSLTAQAAFLVVNRSWREPWWRLAAAYGALLLVVHYAVWEGFPGATTRVVLPLTFGFNVLLARRDASFWGWYLAGNLHLVASALALPFPGTPAPF